MDLRDQRSAACTARAHTEQIHRMKGLG
jgi:hypothetical protein